MAGMPFLHQLWTGSSLPKGLWLTDTSSSMTRILNQCGSCASLMKFIAGRENSARQPDSDKDDRLLHAQIRCAAHRTPQKHRQDRVFRNVPELAHIKMNLCQCFGCDI